MRVQYAKYQIANRIVRVMGLHLAIPSHSIPSQQSERYIDMTAIMTHDSSYNVLINKLAMTTEATVTVVKPPMSIGGARSSRMRFCSSGVRPTLRLTS